jgi:hypothetical protein
MHRRQFLAGVSAVSLIKSPRLGPSVQEAIAILEKAVRREIANVETIRVEIEPDEKKRIAFLFSVVRAKPVA